MPGYLTKQERVPIAGVDDLLICSLLDRQQFADPSGQAARMGISSATWPLFGQLWPSGAQLAARLAQRPVDAGERILEIGCGLALASLVGHRRGADVTASDCHPLARRFLHINLQLNGLRPLKYRHGPWGHEAQADAHADQPGDEPLASALTGHFDLIVGSDVLYERDDRGALAGFIERHAGPAAEVWIVDPDRANRPAFNRQMAALGFELSEERLDQPPASGQPGYKGRLLAYRRRA